MSSLLSAELAATCNALGYYDVDSNKYQADSGTLETVKDLIRYLRRDDENHDIRRQLGETKVLQTDLLPLLKSYWEETDLFDVLVRLLVNLTFPALMLWNEVIPTEKTARNHYLQVEGHLQNYKEAFADEQLWAVLSTRLSKVLVIDYAERGDENNLIIERILILIRNILHIPPNPVTEKRPDNDASIHDQVLWALNQSGMLDIILYITSSVNEKAYYMHTLEILSFMLREQKASDLAQTALQRSETEKIRDEAELLAIRHREANQRQQKAKVYHGARHSRFGGTYILESMKSISDNKLIYHKPFNKLDALNFDIDKRKPKTPKNRMPVQSSTFERRSAFSIRLFLKEFCVELLNGAYNSLMHHVKDNLVRAKAQPHDESYYLWALRFFMEFNRGHKFEVKLVSETMSTQTFRYVQQLMENYFDMIQCDKKKLILWSRRLHLALLAYRELLLTISFMDKSSDGTVRDSARVIKSNLFYILEYREMIITLLITYDELKMSNVYLKDLMETQHVFIKMLERFCNSDGSSVVVQKKTVKKRKKKRAGQEESIPVEPDMESRWDEVAPQLSAVLGGGVEATDDVVPFDAASDVPIDEQKSETMKNVQRKLRNGEFENAISLLRAAREVWPENDSFGSHNMTSEEEFLALRDIFFADLGDNDTRAAPEPTTIPDDDGDEEDEEEEGAIDFSEGDFNFADFSKRLANPKVVRACGLALRDFETNSVNTNHCIIKLLHRIAFDSKMYVMVFQVSLFRTFQKIYANKEFPQYRELVKFATYIIRQFVKVAETNKKVYMEALFWKSSSEAHDIEHGYLDTNKKSTGRMWTEEQEDELRRLFMEHQEKQLGDDIVDWIVNNLIDNTRTRRGVLKKLKEMFLLSNYKSRGKSGPGVSRQWGAEEETQLRELFEQFKDAVDPLGCIMLRLDVSRPKNTIIQKLLELGVIQDRKEVRKKQAGKSRKRNPWTDRDDPRDLPTTDSEQSDVDVAGPSTLPQSNQNRHRGASRKKSGKALKKSAISEVHLTKLLINLVNLGMVEALEWLQDSFKDAMEDFEDDNSEGVPLVPIMDYAVDAMENTDFQQTLKAFGINEPFDEQESYWRIPSDFSRELLSKNIELLQHAIDNTLVISEEANADQTADNSPNNEISDKSPVASLPIAEEDSSNDSSNLHLNRQHIDSPEFSSAQIADDDVPNILIKKKKSQQQIVDSDDEEEAEMSQSSRTLNTKGHRTIFDSDSESENVDPKRNRIDSDSETEKPSLKRSRVILSDDED